MERSDKDRPKIKVIEHFLLLAKQLGLLQVGTVSIDGTKIDAKASKIKSLRYDRIQALRAKLDAAAARLEAAVKDDPPAPPPGRQTKSDGPRQRHPAQIGASRIAPGIY